MRLFWFYRITSPRLNPFEVATQMTSSFVSALMTKLCAIEGDCGISFFSVPDVIIATPLLLVFVPFVGHPGGAVSGAQSFIRASVGNSPVYPG